MNFEEARLRFRVPEIAEAVNEERDENGDQIRAGVRRVSLRQHRLQNFIIVADGVADLASRFGPCANAQFFNTVFAIDPVFKELVLLQCGAGIFQRRITHINVVKMIQLLSLGRLGRAGVLPNQTTTRVSYVQALALAETLGPYLPTEWHLSAARSREEIILAVQWLMGEDGRDMCGLETADWYNEDVLGVDAGMIEGDVDMTIHDALVVLEAMAVQLPTNAQWANGVSFVAMALVSLCRRGTISDEHRQKVIEGLREVTSSSNIHLSTLTIKRFYQMYCVGVNAENAAAILEHYKGLVPDNVIVLRNVIVQAAGSGLTTYMTILRALQTYLDFPWAVMQILAPQDFANIRAAIEAVGGNVYFGFNQQMGGASAKKFPSLAYASFQLCIKVGGDRPLARYQGMPQVIPGKPEIDRMIDAYIAARAEAVEAPGEGHPAFEIIEAIQRLAAPAYARIMGVEVVAPA